MATLKHAYSSLSPSTHQLNEVFFAVIWDTGDSKCVFVWFYFKSGMEGAFNVDPLKWANRSSDIVSL